jgi:hypothetical protein
MKAGWNECKSAHTCEMSEDIVPRQYEKTIAPTSATAIANLSPRKIRNHLSNQAVEVQWNMYGAVICCRGLINP